MNLFKDLFRGKKLFWLIFGLLIISTVVDLYSAFDSALFKVGEANPIYLFTGNQIIFLILTISVTIWIMLTLNKKISYFGTFLFSMVAIYSIFGHSLGAYSNISSNTVYENLQETNATQAQEYYEALEQTSVAQKSFNYSFVVFLWILIPTIMSLIAFNFTFRIVQDKISEREETIGKIQREIKKLVF